jgi:hypothetical protein
MFPYMGLNCWIRSYEFRIIDWAVQPPRYTLCTRRYGRESVARAR